MTASGARAADASVLRVHAPSRLAFAGTTLALVTLASLSTAALISTTTSVTPGTVAPRLQALPPEVGTGGDPVVVDRAPGTWSPPRAVAVPTVVATLNGAVPGAGSDPLPSAVVVPAAFPVVGVLHPAPAPPAVAVPVAAEPVVDPAVVVGPRGKAPRPATPDVRTPGPSPKVDARRAGQAAERGRKHQAKHPKGQEPQIEDLRFHEQERHARQAEHAQRAQRARHHRAAKPHHAKHR